MDATGIVRAHLLFSTVSPLIGDDRIGRYIGELV
ncbi:hypothetical protein X768_14270 [Mesorhizobium sp. LSJC265A00]|nr:hypothetical protein X768_14270 [Mesorhizobium sp. LSJC265A00]ESX20954.1 hypothetical protein X766_04460 [Mesorhizobium sp. LSJC255A00]ESX91300.1 hypothetical protein X756_02370 [Mesorhizobium sp. LSHC412B00]